MSNRIEHDLLGEREIPAGLRYGIHTLRALENFPFAGVRVPGALVKAMAAVKSACAKANAATGHLTQEKAGLIAEACRAIVADTDLSADFPLPALQGGAGTSLNMNLNEVIANRALEALSLPHGSYGHLHPLADVNMHQSTNDVYPTALKIALIRRYRELAAAAAVLQGALQGREKVFADVVMMGRTEMQDAVPITLGAQFAAMAEAVGRDRWRTFKCEERLRSVNIGGTAVGTGLAAPRDYIFRVIETLREETGLPLTRADLAMDATANADCYVEVGGMLSALATNLLKICGDLRTMHYLREIRLPARQAGSSIMPGKVNPVVLEAVMSAALRAQCEIGLVERCASLGSFQINEFLPTIAQALLAALDLLETAVTILADTVTGIEADAAVCRSRVDESPTMITAFVPHIGYESATEILKEWDASGRSVSLKGFLTSRIAPDLVETVLSTSSLMSLGYR